MKRLRWVLLGLAWACAAGATELTPQERDGQQIFLHGTSPSGARIAAVMGMGGGFELTGQAVACGNCHGEDGRGRPEGGIEPSNIVWSELVKSYGHSHGNGRKHGPFDEVSLRRAVIDGEDPAGNRFEGAMPRFSMSARDFASLAAYLKKLETVLDPGLSEGAIQIGTLLPLSGRLADVGAAVRDLLQAYFAALNQRGGIHGRRLELVVEPLPGDAAQARAATRRLIEGRRVFALLAPFSAGVEAELSSAAASAQVPVIGPLTLFPEDAHASNQLVFHLTPGIVELAQVLGQHAAREHGIAARPLALLHADTPEGLATAEAVVDRLSAAGWTQPLRVPFPPRASFAAEPLARELSARGVAAVLPLSAGADLPALARAGAGIGWVPQLLLPGPLAPPGIVDLPAAFRSRVTLAYPSSPTAQRDEALREFAALTPGAAAARGHQRMQQAAYAAGLLFVEGLKRTGRELTRRKLIATLESVQNFDTGLLPPFSFNADRRIGAMGGYLVAVDVDRKALRPLGAYQRLP